MLKCSNLKKFPAITSMKNLETLDILSYHGNYEIPEIQSDMENLVKLRLCSFRMQVFVSSVAVHCPNLISLEATHDNGSNHFSRLDFNLSKLTKLVHLDLSCCCWLEKLPEFPSGLISFRANGCNKLTYIGDVNRNCKWLCQVSVKGGCILNDGDRLLQSMLQGNAIENHSMVLQLEGLQIPRELRPRLRGGTECTLQLPENWCNDFCGFLMCAVINEDFFGLSSPKITMKKVRGDSEDDVDWVESVDDKMTWVGYVSFGSLRHSVAWLDEIYKAVSFSIIDDEKSCRGFGVSLVPRTSGSGPTDTSPPEYELFQKKYDFKPEFEIEDDLDWQLISIDDFEPEFKNKDDSTCTFWIPSVI